MKRILVFQHVAHEILGTFHPLLKKAGIRIRYANFARHPAPTIEMSRYEGLVILGGPMGAYETEKYPHLVDEVAAIREAVHDGKPVLGICLGAQLVATALGAEVKPCPQKEIGWYDVTLTEKGSKDPVLGSLEPTEKIFQWHGDVFQLPGGAERLAESPACPHQAFRAEGNIYGFQFHLEVDQPMIERWLKIPSNVDELTRFGGPHLADQIRADTLRHIGRLQQISQRVFSRYLELVCTKRRTLVLGSGHK